MERINEQEIYNFCGRKNKWLGIIDYKTLAFLTIYIFIIVKLVSLLNIYYLYKVYIIVNLVLPLIIFILLNIREESVIDKLIIIILYYTKRKKYIKTEYYAKLMIKYVKNVEK